MKAFWRSDAKQGQYSSVSMVESDDDVSDDAIGESVSLREFCRGKEPSAMPLLYHQETDIDLGNNRLVTVIMVVDPDLYIDRSTLCCHFATDPSWGKTNIGIWQSRYYALISKFHYDLHVAKAK